MVPSLTITDVLVTDVRVPTSDSLMGSDPFHKKPDYSAVVIQLLTDGGVQGYSLVFNIGAGNDWVAYGVRDLAVLVVGQKLDTFIRSPAALHQLMVEHHQMRWLADGVFRMAAGGVINAMWDLWAQALGKPMWALLADLSPEEVVSCVDWRYLRDVLSPDEALEILNQGRNGIDDRRKHMQQQGPVAYSTSGWLGLSDEQIEADIRTLQSKGFQHFKTKVGGDLEDDIKRLGFLRDVIGDEGCLMTDANQIWGVDEAIEWMEKLTEFRPFWIEEPTARDDVLGFMKIRQALKPHNIGVAAGEQVPSPVIFKQMLASGALTHCQIDAIRMGGVNDVIAVILVAAKYGIPVCPHGGGIGLCNMIRHYAIWDQLAVSCAREGRFVEYLNFLQDDVFESPVTVANGCYDTPRQPGWGLEMKATFVEKHEYPIGAVWADRPGPKGPAFVA